MFACAVLILISAFTWQNLYVDDAFIGFRCIDNLLAGHGLVFNRSARVEAVTNTGWLLMLTPLAAILGSAAAGKLAGAFLLLIAAWLICSMSAAFDCSSNRDNRPSMLRFLIPMLAFSSPALLFFSHSGMETALVCVLVAAPFLWSANRHRLLIAALVYAAAYSVRPECLLLFPLYAAAEKYLIAGGEENASARLSIIVWVSGILVITAARLTYFGGIFPDTFYAKPSALLDVLVRCYKFCAGDSINLPGPFAGIFLLPILGLGIRRLAVSCREILPICLAGSVTGVVFAVYSGDDWTFLPRYFAPYQPFYLLVIFAGLQDLGDRLENSGRTLYAAFMGCTFLFLMLANLVDQVRWVGEPARAKYPGYVLTSEPLREPVLDLVKTLPAGSVVASRRIGLLGYLSSFEIFDYTFGLPDREIIKARNAVGGRLFDDPNDVGLAEIWKRQKPPYFLEDRSRIRRMLMTVDATPAEFRIHGIKYREIKSYRIGTDEDWVLCQAISD